METYFKDKAKIKNQRPTSKANNGKNVAWDYSCPDYDNRSSVNINAGTHYGVGYKVPVGHEGNPTVTTPYLPSGRVKTAKTDEVG